MSAPGLLPCPFCNSGPAVTKQNASFSGVELVNYRGLSFVNCGTCGTEGPKMALDKDAVKEWNTRADLPPTLSAALAVPEVAALVDAAKVVHQSFWHGSDGVICGMYDLERALAALDAAKDG